jgi:hypothetical protein
MLTMAGIPNRLVDGYTEGQSHLWNKVYVGGRWYNLDVTWDDPIPDKPGRVRWQYYNLTDDQMAQDHTWNQSGLPVAKTDFAQTLAKLLPNTSDKGLSRIANETGILNELNSPLVTSEMLSQALQQAIDERKTSVTFKFHGTVNEAQYAISTLFAAGLTGFRHWHASIEPSRTSGYVLITFTITY